LTFTGFYKNRVYTTACGAEKHLVTTLLKFLGQAEPKLPSHRLLNQINLVKNIGSLYTSGQSTWTKKF